MLFSNLLGHALIKKQLLHYIENKTFPCALLFHGISGIGKRLFALECAKGLMGEEHHYKIEKGCHPDLHIFLPEGKAKLHTMDQIREMIDQAMLAPFEAKCRVFIIEQAEKMLPATANALLKILEEPPSHVHFILITEHVEEILPTLLSRLIKIAFYPLEEPVIEEAIMALSYDKALAKSAAFSSQGSLRKALEIAEKKNHKLTTLLTDLLKLSIHQDFSEVVDICSEAQKVYEEESIDGYLLFEEILYWFRDMELLKAKGNPELLYFPHLHKELEASSILYHLSLDAVHDLVAESVQALRHNIRLNHVLEHFLIQAQNVATHFPI